MPETQDNGNNTTQKSNHDTTYVFTNEDQIHQNNVRILWQIIPSICGSLMCLSFGIMLGWPSPTYITLLSEDSPLPITMVQSPMIAGFLMFGNIAATPLSNYNQMGSKNGILVALLLITFGWSVMWQARNIYFLLLSRFLIGVGQGFGIGQVRAYIRNTCDLGVCIFLTKCLNILIISGILIAYIFGLWFDFRTFSLVATFMSIIFFFITFLLPQTPPELIRFGDFKEAKRVLNRIKNGINIEYEIQRIKQEQSIPMETYTLCDVLKNIELRNNLFILVIITFVQQFSGAPATIVYCQFIFTKLEVPYPELCAIFYGVVFVFLNIIGSFYTHKFNKRYLLAISSISVFLILTTQILMYHFKIEAFVCPYIYLFSMISFIVMHTLGLGSVPFTLVEYLFPKNSRPLMTNFHIMIYSLFAVIITKLFQVFFSAFGIIMIFVLFAGVSLFGSVFILLFIPRKPKF